jgi:hypothetical protein
VPVLPEGLTPIHPSSRVKLEGRYSKNFCHRVLVNNVAGSIKIQTEFSISQLKDPSSTFRQYFKKERFHINSVQLGVEEGVTMGW